MLDLADQMKKDGFCRSLLVGSRAVAVLFDKRSLRTRVSSTSPIFLCIRTIDRMSDHLAILQA